MARSPYQLIGPPINTKITPGRKIPTTYDSFSPGCVVKYYDVNYIDPTEPKTPDNQKEE